MKPMTVREFFQKFPDDETCLEHIFESRFGRGHKCPNCEKSSNWYRTRLFLSVVRIPSAPDCRHTVRAFTHAPATLVLRHLLVHHDPPRRLPQRATATAWRMGQEIRKHMVDVDGEDPLSGHVEIDEAYIGGKSEEIGKPSRDSKKSTVFGMVERNGDVMANDVPDTRSATPTIGVGGINLSLISIYSLLYKHAVFYFL